MMNIESKKMALVCGAGGFIGSHMVARLKKEGYWVRGVDWKEPSFGKSEADEFILGDLSDQEVVKKIFDCPFDETYQFAADMGGAGFIFTGEHDAEIMLISGAINLNILKYGLESKNLKKVFYSSSACIYPAYNQQDANNPKCSEESAYPAAPDSEYGWEKLFSERLYLAAHRNHGLEVRIARFHNIFGPQGTWTGGREKAPAAISRKVIEAADGSSIDMWGDGNQTRSFLYIDECIEGVRRLVQSDFTGPVNIGSEEMISINGLAEMAMKIGGKKLTINHIPGPLGVRGRNSDNKLIKEKLGWAPSMKLEDGMRLTYAWIKGEAEKAGTAKK